MQVNDEDRQVFTEVLNGMRYTQVASARGWSRQRVHRVVMRIAAALQEVVGVVGVDEDARPSYALLRARSDAYREALEHFDPSRAVPTPRRGTLVPEARHLDALLECAARGRAGERDTALVLILFATAAKPAEIAGLEVRDVLAPDGTMRTESTVRAAIAFNGRSRTLYLGNARLRAALEAYLAQRVARGHGLGEPGRWRGLNRTSPLFLRLDGQPFTCGSRASAAINLQRLYYQLFRSARIPGLSSLGVRHAAARHLKQSGLPERQIAQVLGLRQGESIKRLLGNSVKPHGEARAMEGLV